MSIFKAACGQARSSKEKYPSRMSLHIVVGDSLSHQHTPAGLYKSPPVNFIMLYDISAVENTQRRNKSSHYGKDFLQQSAGVW